MSGKVIIRGNGMAKCSSFKEQSDAWQTKIHCFLRLPFPLSWILVAGVLAAVGYVFHVRCDGGPISLQAYLILSVMIAVLGNATVYIEMLLDDVADAYPKLLDEDEVVIENWLTKCYDNIFWSRKNIVAGFLAGCVLVWTATTVAPRMVPSTILRFYIYFLDFLIGVLAGSLGWIMFGFAQLSASLGNDVRIRPSIFDTSTSSVRASSSVLWKISLTGALIYILALSVYYFFSAALNTINMIMVVTAGLGVVLYFIVPQMNIHKTLRKLKQDRLDLLVAQIDSSFDQVAMNPNPTNLNQLKELFNLQRVVDSKKSWSFGTGELIALIGLVVVPLLLFLLGYLTRD